MNFGKNLLTWFQSNAQALVLLGLTVMGIWILVKREFTKLIPLFAVGIIAVILVFNTTGAKDVLLKLGNQVIK